MYFKIDYDRISDIGSELVTKTQELDALYSDIIEIYCSISKNWKSSDANVYYTEVATFLNEREDELEAINIASTGLRNVSSKYSEQDNKFLNELIKNEIREEV